ncbi:hypothetical protein F5Y16DRAFT_358494 [Xylariaceae sp. FL0255]|nr:hypothetical protein F5Y16DRAFT_358494 [Xylariaceae sp. FL0255]
MRHTTTLLTPSKALHRMLTLELASRSIASSSSPNIFRIPSTSTSPILKRRAVVQQCPILSSPSPCTRTFSTTAPQRRIFKRKRPGDEALSPADLQKSKKNAARPRDRAIPFTWVRIVDADTGDLGPAKRKNDVLRNMREGYSLVMVAAPPPPQDPSAASPETFGSTAAAAVSQTTQGRSEYAMRYSKFDAPAAICKIVNAYAERMEQARLLKEAKKLASKSKIIGLGWAIAGGDLSHKMKRMTQFLEKGMTVEVELLRKKDAKTTSRAEQDELVRKVREVATAGGRRPDAEYKRADGKLGYSFRMFFDGKAKMIALPTDKVPESDPAASVVTEEQGEPIKEAQ